MNRFPTNKLSHFSSLTILEERELFVSNNLVRGIVMQRSRWFVGGMLLCMLLVLIGPLFVSRATFASQSAPSAEVAAVSPLVASSQLLGNVDPQQMLSMSI